MMIAAATESSTSEWFIVYRIEPSAWRSWPPRLSEPFDSFGGVALKELVPGQEAATREVDRLQLRSRGDAQYRWRPLQKGAVEKVAALLKLAETCPCQAASLRLGAVYEIRDIELTSETAVDDLDNALTVLEIKPSFADAMDAATAIQEREGMRLYLDAASVRVRV